MRLLMKINEDKRVIHCFKNLSQDEIEALEHWGRVTSCDVLSYFKLPLFAISRGDFCYDFGFISDDDPVQETAPEAPASSLPSNASLISPGQD